MFIFDFVRFGLSILIDQRGEEEVIVDGEPAAPVDGQGAEPDADNNQEPAAPAAPRYGEYGDDADKVWEAHQNVLKEFNTLKGKTTATERNMANLRKAIDGVAKKYNSRPVYDESGNFVDFEYTKPAERKRVFTDDHKNKFNAFFDKPESTNEFLELTRALVQDMLDEFVDGENFTGRIKNNFGQFYNEFHTNTQKFVAAKTAAQTKLTRLFPAIIPNWDKDGKPTNPDFNKALYDKATELWENNKEYRGAPDGELRAAIDAAVELGINPSATEQARKQGFQEGVKNKQILAPVNSGKTQGKKYGKLSSEAYLALSPEEQDAYDKQEKGL